MIVNILLVIAGGAVGAVLRYGTSQAVKARVHSDFRWGTFIVNVAACLLLGAVVEAGVQGEFGLRLQLLLATGLSGALSTWATFSYELLTLVSARRLSMSAMYLLLTLAVGLGMSFAGAELIRGLG